MIRASICYRGCAGGLNIELEVTEPESLARYTKAARLCTAGLLRQEL